MFKDGRHEGSETSVKAIHQKPEICEAFFSEKNQRVLFDESCEGVMVATCPGRHVYVNRIT